MRISDWSSDVCSSDLIERWHTDVSTYVLKDGEGVPFGLFYLDPYARADKRSGAWMDECINRRHTAHGLQQPVARSEEHTSELQSLMRISYAVFCLKKKKKNKVQQNNNMTITYTRKIHHQAQSKYTTHSTQQND